jgi:hypothetical protein
MLQFFPITIVLQLPPLIQAGYLGLCVLLAGLARNKTMGFWGMFFGSIILSPIVGLLILLVSKERTPRQPKVKSAKATTDNAATISKG